MIEKYANTTKAGLRKPEEKQSKKQFKLTICNVYFAFMHRGRVFCWIYDLLFYFLKKSYYIVSVCILLILTKKNNSKFYKIFCLNLLQNITTCVIIYAIMIYLGGNYTYGQNTYSFERNTWNSQGHDS